MIDLAIGFFDGVHLGHRQILSQADVALTFSEHPLSVLAPERAPALLMTLGERLAAIRGALRYSPAVDDDRKARALKFTREFAAMAPKDFAAMLRRDYPDLGTVYCGPNWSFGAGGEGNADFLSKLGFRVGTVPFETVSVCEGTVPISSTRIRAALATGDLALATAMLGHGLAVTGKVVPGKGMGRHLGFPTINLRPDNPDLRRLLPMGVYRVDSSLGGGIANWGLAPTMGESAWEEPVLEFHVIDHAVEAAGLERPPSAMTVSLVAFVRHERKFATLAELQSQIAADCSAYGQGRS